ncbi:hypothetical protein V6Z11_A12G240000 [Gossypium hirsutum]
MFSSLTMTLIKAFVRGRHHPPHRISTPRISCLHLAQICHIGQEEKEVLKLVLQKQVVVKVKPTASM